MTVQGARSWSSGRPLHGEWDGPLLLGRVTVRIIAAGEVLVHIAVSASGIPLAVARDQVVPVPPPIVLGHEASGTIVAVGHGIGDLPPGDRVVLRDGIACEPYRGR